jgi:hypothetical protein
MPAQIVTVEAIQADPANGGNDLSERIRSFLRRMYENWNTRWVLLGGHVTEVPSRGTYVQKGKYHTQGNLSDLYYGDVLPKDLSPETDVEIYNWNGDGDGRFGENRDGMDLIAEMYVARLPFTTKGQVETYLKKYFTYARGTKGDHLGRALLVGAEEFRRPQEFQTKTIQRLGSERGYKVDTLIEVPVPEIVKWMNKGYGIIDIYGHGCPHHMWLGENRSHFGVPQIESLSNEGKYGVVYSHGCSSNDYRKWESMGIAFLLNPKGGSVSYTGYTAASFGSPVYRMFYDMVFKGTVPQLARAFAEGKKRLLSDVWMNEYLNILGEPEMWVWTASPQTLRVEGELEAGRPARLRLLGPDGEAVSRARVCLVQRGVYLVGESDAKGVVHLSAPEAGRVQVFVMAQNYHPFEGTLTAAKGKGPVLKAPEVLIDDDTEGESRGNARGDLSPDETVELRMQWAEAPSKGTLSLELDDPFVKVIRGEIPAGKGDASFLIKILGGVRPGHNVWSTVRLKVSGVEGSWSWRSRLPVQGPSLRCVRVRMDDRKGNKDGRLGWEDAGGTVAVFVTVFNRGNQVARDVQLKLACRDDAVTLPDDALRLVPLKPMEAVETRAGFSAEIKAGYDGHPLEFQLEMRDREGGLWKATIRVAVPPAPPVLLSHTAGTSHILLSWRPGGTPGVAGYYVYRAARVGGPFKRVTEKPVRGMTCFRDPKVKPNGTYYYAVTAVTKEGLESILSLEHRARTLTPLWGKRR